MPNIWYRASMVVSFGMDPRLLLAGMTEKGGSFPTLCIGNLFPLHSGWILAVRLSEMTEILLCWNCESVE